jgi:mannose-6-phosphate isomerase-like protein (cupin superfamily)
LPEKLGRDSITRRTDPPRATGEHASERRIVAYVSGEFSQYTFDPADIEVGQERLLPKLFGPGGGMKRFAAPEDGDLRAGFTRVPAGEGFSTFFWYKEIWYVVEGTAELEVLDKRTGEKQTVRIGPRDALYFPEGVRVRLTNDGQESIHFLYCAVPASRRDAPWLAAMDEEDLDDVRQRGEYPGA